MRYRIRGKITAICLILGAFWPLPASAQPQTSSGQDAAGGLFARPRPFLEEALGYRLNGPPSFRTVAVSSNAPFAAIADDQRRIYGLQFHPEVAHTPDGTKLLRAFTHGIAGCSGDSAVSTDV